MKFWHMKNKDEFDSWDVLGHFVVVKHFWKIWKGPGKKGFLIFRPQSLRKLRKIYLICFSRKVSISLPNLCEYELLAPGQENADRKLDENDQLGLRVIASFGNHSVAIINFYMSNPTKLYHFHIKVFDIIFSVYFLYKIYNCRICKKISPFIS